MAESKVVESDLAVLTDPEAARVKFELLKKNVTDLDMDDIEGILVVIARKVNEEEREVLNENTMRVPVLVSTHALGHPSILEALTMELVKAVAKRADALEAAVALAEGNDGVKH
jgi:hypothetical protein